VQSGKSMWNVRRMAHMARECRKKECCRHCLRTERPSGHSVLAKECQEYASVVERMREHIDNG